MPGEAVVFAERYRPVRYDLRGFGGSTATGPGTTCEELVALLDGIGVRSERERIRTARSRTEAAKGTP